MSSYPVHFIVGPTAVGKSALALRLANEWGGVIANGDSVQCYQLLQIGAAKPSAEERAQVPHVLFDIVAPQESLTAAEYRRVALLVIETEQKSRPVWIVGGSGFYLRALEKGVYPIGKVAQEVTEKWQSRLRDLGPQALYRELQIQDPSYAEKLSPNDGYRIARALTVIESEGRTWTDIKRQFEDENSKWPYRGMKIGLRLPREVLKERIRLRTEIMVKSGLRDEVKQLLDMGLGNWPALRSVGYKETVSAIRHNWSDAELIDAIILSTVQLAKKQMTWFNSDPTVRWFSPEDWLEIKEALAQWFDS